jgi:NADPH2:quinone reductase
MADNRERAAIARATGCDEVILYREEDFAARVKHLTNGRAVDVIYAVDPWGPKP